MKVLLTAAALAVGLMAVTATAADARPWHHGHHRHCSSWGWHHHHHDRWCRHWGW
jgi:Spy/CpxP family protein refolding chaperone